MKKTYINPSMVVVSLSMSKFIAVSGGPSAGIDRNSSQAAESLDVKSVSDVNVWDDEW